LRSVRQILTSHHYKINSNPNDCKESHFSLPYYHDIETTERKNIFSMGKMQNCMFLLLASDEFHSISGTGDLGTTNNFAD